MEHTEEIEIRLLAAEIVRLETEITKLNRFLDIRFADVFEAKKEAFESLKSGSPDYHVLFKKFKKLYKDWEKGQSNFMSYMNKKQDLTFQLLRVKSLYNSKKYFFEEKKKRNSLQ